MSQARARNSCTGRQGSSVAAAPDVYYVTDHYTDYSAVLVRLSRINPDVLQDLLGMAYKFVTANVAPPSPSRKRRKLGPRR